MGFNKTVFFFFLFILPALWLFAQPSAEEVRDPATTEKILDRPLGMEVLKDGSWLITDGGGAWRMDDTGSEILMVDPEGKVTWRYGQGLRFAHSAVMLSNGNILIPDTGNNRLIEVNRAKQIVWTSESWPGGRLSDGSRLDYPNHVQELEGGFFLVSDRNNSRIIEIDRAGTIRWSFHGTTRQHAPVFIGNGRYLVADSEGNRVLEIDGAGNILWSFSEGLRWPRCVEKLDNGNYLITDSNNHRILEVSPAGAVVAELKGPLRVPYEAHRLSDGTTLVCDAQHGRVLVLDAESRIVREFRNLQYPSYADTPHDPGFESLPPGVAVDLEAGVESRPLDYNGWHVADMVGHGSGIWAVDDAVAREGEKSVSIESKKNDRSRRWWGQRIAVRPGERLNLFCSIKTETVPPGAAGIGITWMDEMGGQLGGVSGPALYGSTDWTVVPLSVLVPEGAAMAEISLTLVGRGKAWFDGLEFGREQR